MPTPVFTSTNDLQFNATDDGTSLTWTSNTLNGLNAIDVIDENDDGNLDSGVDTWANGARVYSGYTININGNDYAIFGSGTSYNIPYDAAFDDLSVFASSLNPGTTTTTENENGTAQNFCFLTGTRIATPSGQRAIETLNAGEMVLTQSGGAVPVLWLGKQTIRRSSLFAFGSGAVRIAAGALGDGVPRADLIVTGDHGLIVDGYVVNASAMVNGSTIHSVPLSDLPAEFSWWHIETEAHEVILAEGAAAETFIDAAGRAAFDNHDAYLDRFGAERIIPEMRLPRITASRLLPESIRARLEISAASLAA